MHVLLALLFLVPPAFASDARQAQWQALIEARDVAKAKTLCEPWLASKDRLELVEAHKCLSHVELAGAGGVDKALAHLDAAAELAPQDRSIHEDRLRLLIGARRFSDLSAALEKSIKAYPAADGLDAWLPFCADLQEGEWYEEGLAYAKTLEKHFPKDHRVVANVGGFLGLLERYAEAVPYVKRAVALKPDDPIDNWNMGRLYDRTDKVELADKFYRQAIRLEAEPEEKKDYECLYSEFLKKRRRPGAPAYEKQHCPGGLPDDD